ncbi:hypothetical protein AAKU67_004031 [Oxalobacteraceae bacterium GrIS 2.11]
MNYYSTKICRIASSLRCKRRILDPLKSGLLVWNASTIEQFGSLPKLTIM